MALRIKTVENAMPSRGLTAKDPPEGGALVVIVIELEL
jgi:hypothetical protein